MARIALERIERRFPGGHVAVGGVTLDVADGEFMVLVGPSGCGKSTLLRLIAGLDVPSAGRILIDGSDATATPPQSRDLAMVFQSYALYPHMTVRENLAYGLRVRGTPAAAIDTRVASVAAALELGELLARRPAQLSGGQRQRVALGRALVREPKAFLLDEPLSNLDPALRLQARAELLRLQRRLGATVIYVTHDQEEAMTLGTRAAVMRDGRLEQVGAPQELYHRPVNTFVGRFIGAPPMNLLAGWADGPGDEETTIGIRPQDVILDSAGPWTATVDLVEPRGHDAIVHLRVHRRGRPLLVALMPDPPETGREVRVRVPAERMHRFAPDGSRIGP